ncbi:iron complex outermembrane receptor protein [Nitrospirillum amazonense]|uniref:Iron complex outermembrane receptor protein n=1 Tax=Nitrospirillum amazonense TaxID=28077 RepID=A0A560K9U6_9PROT|nr:TonB-dependent receptor [Nitrospirillum amazonense]TWB80098.1 iron complex outermembrane receptor protein [Nitrospirillum amazonense]
MNRLFRPATAMATLFLATAPFAASFAAAAGATNGADPADAASDAVLKDIVVTAEQRMETLQSAPIAVQAVTGDSLAAGSLTNTADLARALPALVVAPAAGGTPQLYVRGIGTYIISSYAEPAVAFNLDGVYVARPAGASLVFYDLQRLELLPGPQGTLYGRNASAGVLNVVPEVPVLGQTSGHASLEFGNYNLRKGEGALNVPLSTKAALRVAAQVVDRKGYLSDGYDDDQSQAGRVQVLLEPADDLHVRLAADYAHRGGKGDAQVQYPFVNGDNPWIGPSDPAAVKAYYAALPPLASRNPLIRNARNDGFIDDRSWGLKADIVKDFSFATLTLTPAYRGMDEDYLAYVPSAFSLTARSRATSIDARLTSNGQGPLSWVGGVSYFNEQLYGNQYYDNYIQHAVGKGDLDTESEAAYGQVTYAVAPDLRLTAGGRLSHEEKAQTILFGSNTFTAAFPTLLPRQDTHDWNGASWKVGADYDVAPGSLLYASVATGFKAGGFFSSPVNQRDYYGPEHLTAYTVGLKNSLLGGKAQVNLEAFDYEYRDQQITYTAPVQTGVPLAPYAALLVTQNAGRAHMRGLAVDGKWQVTADDLLTASGQYLDTAYDDFHYRYYSGLGASPAVGCAYTNASATAVPKPIGAARIWAVDCAGKPAINAPRWTAIVGYQHDFRLDGGGTVTAAADVHLSSSYQTAYDYAPQQLQGGYHMTNLRLTYTPDHGWWSLTGYINNVENQAVVTSGYQPAQALGAGYNTASIRPPRLYGVRVRVAY